MPATERDRQVLCDIESRLRHQDHFIAARFALQPVRAAMHRHMVSVFLAAEIALLILVALGAMAGQETLLVPAIGVAVAEPLIAIAALSGGRKENS